MTKPIFFISHITEEREIAATLKKLIEDSFLGLVDVFVSSHPQSIQVGQKWLDRISSALKGCVLEIILASPESIGRSWVNFEAGSGWVRGIPIIPICHSGLTPDLLPSPLNSLQAALADEAGMKLVMRSLATEMGSDARDIDASQFLKSVTKHASLRSRVRGRSEKCRSCVMVMPVDSASTPHERDDSLKKRCSCIHEV